MSKLRDRWPSEMLFIFAAVGSAVGLGNVWRFPYLVGKYGGGAFLFPYMIALFLIGFPLLIMEFSLGQMMQRGVVGAMTKVNRRLSGIGLGAVLSSFAVSCYYAVIMAWCLLYCYYSIGLAWGDDSKGFFFEHVLQASEGASSIDGFALPVLCALFVTWMLIYFSIWKGIKSVSAVVKITMPLPIILLVVLLLRTLFLPGAWDGILFFLTPDFSALYDFEVWMAAVTQIFFTLTLGFGVMVTYSSYRPEGSDIIKTALITSIADVGIALLAGFVVFTTIGNMAFGGDASIAELAAAGPSLAFVVFPQALSNLPGAAFFSLLFFVMLATLAIDSLFSLSESVAALFEDFFPNLNKKMIVFFVCFAGFLGGIVFTSSAGIFYLDIFDHFVTNYGLVLLGTFQVIAIGWVFGAKRMREYANSVSTIKIGRSWDVLIKYVIPAALLIILGKTFYTNIHTAYGDFPEWAVWSFGWGVIICILTISLAHSLFNRGKSNG